MHTQEHNTHTCITDGPATPQGHKAYHNAQLTYRTPRRSQITQVSEVKLCVSACDRCLSSFAFCSWLLSIAYLRTVFFNWSSAAAFLHALVFCKLVPLLLGHQIVIFLWLSFPTSPLVPHLIFFLCFLVMASTSGSSCGADVPASPWELLLFTFSDDIVCPAGLPAFWCFWQTVRMCLSP